MITTETRDAVRARLALLASSNGGRLTPEAVVEDAKSKDSPLHVHFEWDAKKAAYAHWLDQARSLITSVRIEMRTDTTVVSAVAYVRDPNATGHQQGYVSTETLRTDKELARSALVSEFGRVADMLRRARELAAAMEVQDEVEALLDGVVGLRRKVMDPPAQRQ